jgi:hypothetical protein
MNPYTQVLTDEASGLQYINPKWEAWEEGKKEGRREVVDFIEQYEWTETWLAWQEQKTQWFKEDKCK